MGRSDVSKKVVVVSAVPGPFCAAETSGRETASDCICVVPVNQVYELLVVSAPDPSVLRYAVLVAMGDTLTPLAVCKKYCTVFCKIGVPAPPCWILVSCVYPAT